MIPDRETLLSLILDALPFPVIFVDMEDTIRYLNEPARVHYYEERGCPPLLGKSIFECHSETSSERIRELVQRLRATGEAMPLHPDGRGDGSLMSPVFDGEGQLIGYFKRLAGPHEGI